MSLIDQTVLTATNFKPNPTPSRQHLGLTIYLLSTEYSCMTALTALVCQSLALTDSSTKSAESWLARCTPIHTHRYDLFNKMRSIKVTANKTKF